jgi:murein DD-endopeptidase MepM/ murein hydrolase activator NlpD
MKPTILWPVEGKYPLTFLFGEAPKWYTDAFGYPHNGVDIGCPIGTPIRAVDDGTVLWADNVPDKDGRGVILGHSWGQSLCWHLSLLTATFGLWVKKGDIIAFSGKTGFATGPHLHFGVQVTGITPEGMRGWSDPRDYLTAQPAEPDPPEPIKRKYLVLPGDTLWAIAEFYYGDGAHWRMIWDANKEKIANPNLIRPWQLLNIP